MIVASASGSSVATTFAIGSILIPAMVKESLAAAVQATSAELGTLIPPSIRLILYGIATGTSVGELFPAGVGPGLPFGFALMIYLILASRRKGFGVVQNRMALSLSLRRAFWALVMPVVVLGGILTPTDTAAVAVIYALAVGVLVFRKLTVSNIIPALRNSVIASTAILMIICCAGLFSFLLSLSGLPGMLSEWIVAIVHSRIAVLLAVNLFLFIIGMFNEGSAVILVLAPLLAPVAASYGINPVHFGLIIVTNLALGMCTPPIGGNLFAPCTVAGIQLHRIIVQILPMVGVVIICVLIVTCVPTLTIGIVDLFYN